MQGLLSNLLLGTSKKKKLGVYLHVPFCRTRCLYCDFTVYLDHKKKYFDLYTNSLCKEIEQRINSQELENYSLESIFIGGGTPTLLEIKQLERIILVLKQKFKINKEIEFTIEANPEGITDKKLSVLRSLGINRLSIGVQSFSEKLLKKLGRGHSNQTVFNLIYSARKKKFKNISLDLIFGLPEQNLEDWGKTIDLALGEELGIKHLSTYLLTIEKKTPFFKIYQSLDHPIFPREQVIQKMYRLLQKKAEAKGFSQYEISNFAKSGFQSVHNLGYWKNQEFLGFGVSAHSYFQRVRQKQTKNLADYIKDPLKTETLNSDLATEELFLALRTKEGLNLKKYLRDHKIDLLKVKNSFIQEALKKNLIKIKNNFLQITPENLLISNEIILNLI